MKIRLVIDDDEKAYAFEARRYEDFFLAKGMEPSLASRRAREHVGNRRAKGTVHAELDMECPDGGTNCRNCGDPDYKEDCKSKGHCVHCGTAHGVAPDSVLLKHGFKIETV